MARTKSNRNSGQRGKTKGRLAANRSSGKYIMFYVEGRSEELYFNHVRQILDLYQSQVKCFKGFKEDVVTEVQKDLQKQPQLRQKEVIVFILFDLDDCKENVYKSNLEKSKGLKFTLCVSNPSFEIWLLAHHERVAPSPLTNREMQRKLSAHWKSEFSKTHPKITEIAKDYEVAIENVKGIKELDFARNLNYTDLDDLIKELKLLKNSS